MDLIDAGVNALGEWVGGVMSEGPLRDLIVDGIIAGVGGVIVFLPQIVILYLFISLLEDSGYMARAAFIMDSSCTVWPTWQVLHPADHGLWL